MDSRQNSVRDPIVYTDGSVTKDHLGGASLSRMDSRQNGVRDPIVYTDVSVTKDQSGWGFTVKNGQQAKRSQRSHSVH